MILQGNVYLYTNSLPSPSVDSHNRSSQYMSVPLYRDNSIVSGAVLSGQFLCIHLFSTEDYV